LPSEFLEQKGMMSNSFILKRQESLKDKIYNLV
jgi:hypothetical protein